MTSYWSANTEGISQAQGISISHAQVTDTVLQQRNQQSLYPKILMSATNHLEGKRNCILRAKKPVGHIF